MSCPFCDKDRQALIEERRHVFVILSDPRLMPGHTLVIPERHIENPRELTKPELDEVMETIFKYHEIITERIAPGCDIRQHFRPFIKQYERKVDHVHFHLQPRFLNDELFREVQHLDKQVFKPLPEEELQKFLGILQGLPLDLTHSQQ